MKKNDALSAIFKVWALKVNYNNVINTYMRYFIPAKTTRPRALRKYTEEKNPAFTLTSCPVEIWLEEKSVEIRLRRRRLPRRHRREETCWLTVITNPNYIRLRWFHTNDVGDNGRNTSSSFNLNWNLQNFSFDFSLNFFFLFYFFYDFASVRLYI